MQIQIRVGFILLILSGISCQPISFCEDQFCYNSDGLLRNVSKLEDAQNYCYNNDSRLLEIYDLKQLNSITTSITGRGPTLLNTIGKVASGWTSILGDPLTNINVDESRGQDFLYLNVTGGQLYFQGAGKLYIGLAICRVPGNCPDGYCYEIMNIQYSWFRSEAYCYTNGSSVASGYGHLVTFEGMTLDKIANLSFVKLLQANTIYWVGYSKLVYNWLQSNIRAYLAYFGPNKSLLTASNPNESYFVYMEKKNRVLPIEWYEKPISYQSFLLICMKDNITTSTKQTSALTTSTSDLSTKGLTTTLSYKSTEVTTGTNPTTAQIMTTNISKVLSTGGLTTTLPQKSTEATTGKTHTTAQIMTSNISKESAVILSLLLPILFWLLFSLCLVCFILPFFFRRNRRKRSRDTFGLDDRMDSMR